jgi:steroid delta-isomerase-like uncharacterized protein
MTTSDDARSRADDLIRQFYEHFNQRRFDAASALFTDDAVLEHTPLRRRQQGGAGYRDFADAWVRAFPDASIAIERVAHRDTNIYEVDLVATGTHLGQLDFGGGGTFKASGVRAVLRMRQLFEVLNDRIVYSGLSFDLQEVVTQLVVVDVHKLVEHLRRIDKLHQRLQETSAEQIVERHTIVQRLGAELDTARHVVRPYLQK